MANPDHVKELLKGVEHWNEWYKDQRVKNPNFIANLRELDISTIIAQPSPLAASNRYPYHSPKYTINLEGIHLTNADLSYSNLTGANLNYASLDGAKLVESKMDRTSLQLSNLKKSKLYRASLIRAELQWAQLSKSKLHDANLKNAKLSDSCLQEAILWNANLKGADLRYADLRKASVARVKYSRWGHFKGIRLSNTHGSQKFIRFAKDQDFIEEFRSWDLDWRPWKWVQKGITLNTIGHILKCVLNPFKWRWKFFLLYLPWLILADCGRSFLLWAGWSVLFALGFGSVYAGHPFWDWLPQRAVPDMKLPTSYESWFSPYYFSIVTFTTLGFGDVTPLNMAGEFWVTAEVILGYVMLGGLISIFANKLARRSG